MDYYTRTYIPTRPRTGTYILRKSCKLIGPQSRSRDKLLVSVTGLSREWERGADRVTINGHRSYHRTRGA